jgi:hypothetical protein
LKFGLVLARVRVALSLCSAISFFDAIFLEIGVGSELPLKMMLGMGK